MAIKLYTDVEIPIAMLELDSENPRHSYIESQAEIMEWLTSGHGKMGGKLLKLSKDISEFGLDPAERITIVRNDSRPDTYITIEGNRRVAALKLLYNPDIAPTRKWRERFREAIPKGYIPLKSVQCVLYNKREDADHFIELKHLNEAGGAGVVSWDAIQKARHEQRHAGSKSRNKNALDILSFVQDSPLFNEQTRQIAGSDTFPITTLQRLLTDRDSLEFLGLGKDEEGDIEFLIDREEAAKSLTKIIEDFGTGHRKVGHVINKEKRRDYFDEFGTDEVPDHSKTLQEPKKVSAASTTQSPTSQRPTSVVGAKSRYMDPRNRTTVVMPGFIIPIDGKKHIRARQVFEELRRLPVRELKGKPLYPNAAILLVRTFIEVSVDTYIRDKGLTYQGPKGWSRVSLRERIDAVIKDAGVKAILGSREIATLKKVLGGQDKLSHPDSIHDMVHNLNQTLIPNDIISIWDTYSTFLDRIWRSM